MKKLSLLIIAVIISLVPAAYAEVKIGLVTDLSGVGSYWGTQSRRGIEMAAKEIESRGGSLKVIAGDHTFKTTAALTEVNRMINVNKVDALWVEFAPAVIATSDTVRKAKKLFLANSAAKSVIGTNPYAFKAYLDYESGCEAIAKYWKSKGYRKIGMLKLDLEPVELCLKGAQREFPDILVMNYNLSEPVNSQLAVMKSKGIEAVLNTALESDMLNTLKALRELKYNIPVGVTEPEGLTSQVQSEYKDLLQGVTSFGFPAVSPAFRARFKEAYPSAPETAIEGAAMAYTHALQIYNSFMNCASKDTECAAKSMEQSPANEALQFLRWDNRTAVYDFTLKEWQNGGTVVIKKGI